MILSGSGNLRLARNERLTELVEHQTSNPVMVGVMTSKHFVYHRENIFTCTLTERGWKEGGNTFVEETEIIFSSWNLLLSTITSHLTSTLWPQDGRRERGILKTISWKKWGLIPHFKLHLLSTSTGILFWYQLVLLVTVYPLLLW